MLFSTKLLMTLLLFCLSVETTSLPGLAETILENTPIKFYAKNPQCSTITVECEDIRRTLSCAFFLLPGVSVFESKTEDVTSVIIYTYLCSSRSVLQVQQQVLLTQYLARI